MTSQIRKFAVIAVVAVLYSIFVFSLGDAVAGEAEYPEICQQSQEFDMYPRYPAADREKCEPLPEPSQEEIDACPGNLYERYTGGQCPTEYTCDCSQITESFNDRKENIIFWIAIALGGLAIVGGMLLPSKKDLNEWIGGGFIIGGIITLFIATAMHWGDIHRIARPIVIALELILVLWLAYRKWNK